jgi:hypothetical protein
MAKEILRTEIERRITLDELVRLVLPDTPENAQVTVRVYDERLERSLPLATFGTVLCFTWSTPERERETEPDAPTGNVRLLPHSESGS